MYIYIYVYTTTIDARVISRCFYLMEGPKAWKLRPSQTGLRWPCLCCG